MKANTKLTLDDLDKSNVWTVTTSELSQMIIDAKKKRDVSRYGFTARLQTDLAKILPHSFVMDYWMKQQKLK